MTAPSENEVIAQELETVGDKVRDLETRVTEVEAVIPRLEAAAEITARAMEEVSSHWDAVYRRCAVESSSGGERNSPRPRKGLRESRQHHKVSMERDPLKPANPERRKAVLV